MLVRIFWKVVYDLLLNATESEFWGNSSLAADNILLKIEATVVPLDHGVIVVTMHWQLR